ncbi:MAG TPA: plastocyanin/azurin family copper-binding protein, partial [Solirubrobacteraceae bacterium]|nr:plastocyanin/azurin family copper-binding protein [Solirubrobacteraceae bacterium]
MRARFRVTVVAAATTVMALPAAAQAPVAVEARPDNTFVPADVRIRTGEEVEWRNRGGFHNVVFDDGSYRQPPVPDPTSWTVRRRFDEPGTFSYVCQAHRDQGMRGTVTVLAPDDPAAPPPQPPPSPEPAPGPAPDESPAAARLSRVS